MQRCRVVSILSRGGKFALASREHESDTRVLRFDARFVCRRVAREALVYGEQSYSPCQEQAGHSMVSTFGYGRDRGAAELEVVPLAMLYGCQL